MPDEEQTPKRSKRGGKRPGAGAPKGNLNGLKHGLRSKQFARIGALLAQEPKVREALNAVAEKNERRQHKANQVAALLLARVVETARGTAGDCTHCGANRLNAGIPTADWRAIKETAEEMDLRQHAKTPKETNSPPRNQIPGTNPPAQSTLEPPS